MDSSKKVSIIDTDSEIIKLFNGAYWAKYEGKWHGSFPTRVGAEAWLEVQEDDTN